MRTINLMIHQQSLHHLLEQTEVLCNLYGRHEANSDTKVTKMKEEEDLSILIDEMLKYIPEEEQMTMCDGYYWNYTIPRIGKEFDLLRIGEDSLVNIEIKSVAGMEKMKVQLEKNRKYLKIMGREVHLFTFLSSTRKLYILIDDTFQETTFTHLIQLLKQQTVDTKAEIDEVFSPVQFLISPFNDTEKFLHDEYFLTTQQERIFTEIIQFNQPYQEILGRVGTGKSLLLYHIAKQLMVTHKAAIVHCGILNEGHRQLKKHGFMIYSLPEWLKIQKDSEVEILCMDEAQRMNGNQLVEIMDQTINSQRKVILTLDPVQVFELSVKKEIPYEKYRSQYHFQEYRLSDHIRSNPDISRFSKDVMNLNEHHGPISSEHIRIHGTDCFDDAEKMIRLYTSQGYHFINYTGSGVNDALPEEEKESIHHIIGQEYDKVVTVLDDAFYYNEERVLDAFQKDDTMYLRPEMFYEAITRARMDIVVIVVNNPSVFTRLLTFFH